MYQLHRPADLRIMRSGFGVIVLVQALIQVIGATDIERQVGAFQYVGVEHHLSIALI